MAGGLSRTGPYGEGQHHSNYGGVAIRKNEIMSCATTWMDLEIIILSEVSQRKTNIM